MKKLRIISLLLVLLTSLSLFCGCNGNSTTLTPTATPASTPTTTPASTSEDADVPGSVVTYPIVTDGSITLTWFYPLMSAVPPTYYDDLTENYSWSLIEKATGINIDLVIPSMVSVDEQYSLMVSSTDYTDLATYPYPDGGDKAIEDEVYMRLNELMDSYAPDYMALLNSDPQNLKDATTDTGNRWMFCQISEGLQLSYRGLAIRQDWMNDLGISEIPRTYDQLHDVLVQFRDNKTEGPFALDHTGISFVCSFSSGYNIFSRYNNYYIRNGEKAICTIATENFRDYLRMCNQWYTEKLIDQNFFSHHIDDVDFDLMFNDKVGLIDTQQIGTYYSDHGLAPAGAYFEPIYAPVKNLGDERRVGLITNIVTLYGASIFTTCVDPVAATKFLNYFYTDQGFIDANYGTEGVTFNYVDGKPILTDMIREPEGMSVWDAWLTYLIGNGSLRYAWNRMDNDETIETRSLTDERWALNGSFPDNMPENISFTAEEGSRRSVILSDLSTYVETMTVNFITGISDLDTEWEEYINTINSIGVPELTQIYQNALDRYNAR
jgi:putative aldouronate transport system substrate-binding protein